MNTDITQPSLRAARHRLAFTLIEMLVVIAVIAILASLIFPITAAVNKAKIRSRTRAEVTRMEAAIESYKTKLGFYPPSDTNSLVPNTLYYELVGTTFNGNAYLTPDNSTMPATAVPTTFGSRIGGFMNCTRGSGDEGVSAHKFLVSMRPDQYLEVVNPTCVLLGTRMVEGPLVYTNTAGLKLNPWRYNAARPVHNTSSYDLWMDVKIGNDIYRINNWGKEYIVKPPYSYWP